MDFPKVKIFSEDNDFLNLLDAYSVKEKYSIDKSLKIENSTKAPAIILDHKYFQKYDLEGFLQEHKDRIILCNVESNDFNIAHLLYPYKLNHLVGLNSYDLAHELNFTVKKYLHPELTSEDLYLVNPQRIYSSTITASIDILEHINLMLSNIKHNTWINRKDYILLLANELLTNAVYNAPRNSSEEPKYSKLDRSQKVVLDKNEHVDFKVAYDNSRIIISVTDSFGALSRDDFINNISKFVHNKKILQNRQGGAGIGLYLAFQNSSSIMIHSKKKQKTEIICMLEKKKTPRQYIRTSSFHFFNER